MGIFCIDHYNILIKLPYTNVHFSFKFMNDLGATIATRAESKWGLNSGLSICLLNSVFYVNSVVAVVCYQSVTTNSNNSSG